MSTVIIGFAVDIVNANLQVFSPCLPPRCNGDGQSHHNDMCSLVGDQALGAPLEILARLSEFACKYIVWGVCTETSGKECG